MNVIEALYITLGLDTREFDQKKEGVTTGLAKLGEASDKQTKTIAESGKKAANAFSMLKIEVLGALAAFGVTTGLKDFISTNMNGQAALGRLSANLGVSTQRLQAWKLAAKEMGQSGEDALGALQAVAKGVAEARITGHSALTQASRRFGFAIDPKDNEQTLINISRRMAETHDRQQAIMIAEAAGVGNIANLLLQGPDKLQAQLAHTMSLTGAVTKESAEQAALLQARWADLQERFQQVSERVFIKLEPVLARLGERLANWLDSINWQKVIDGLSHFIDKVNDVVEAFGGWKTIVIVLGGVLSAKLLSPLFGLISVFGKLIPLLGTATTGATGMGAAFAGVGAAVGIAAAALAGWKLGEWISNNLSPEKQEQVGRFTTILMAAGGSDEARETLNREDKNKALQRALEDPNVRPDVKKAAAGKTDLSDPAVIRLLSASDRAQHGLAMGIRNNNPGNLRTGEGGTFGRYATPQEGLEALSRQLSLYYTGKSRAAGGRSLDTLQDIIATYAPSNENNTAAYIGDLSKRLGVQPGQRLNLSDPSVLGALMKGIVSHENGQNPYSDAMFASAAAKYAQSVPLSQRTPAMATQRPGGAAGGNSVTINGGVNVNAPKARDANDVAKDMQSAMVRHPLMSGFTEALA